MGKTKKRMAIMHCYWKVWVSKYLSNWSFAFTLNVAFFALSAVIPFIFKGVIDSLIVMDSRVIAYWIAIYILAEGLQLVLLYSKGYAGRMLEMKVERDIKTAMYNKFYRADYLSSVKMKPGEAIQRITSDVVNTRPLIVESFSELVGHLLLLIIVVILMFLLSPYLTIFSLFFMLIYAIGFNIYQKRAPKYARQRQRAQAQFVATLEEGLDSNYSVRVQGSHKTVMNVFSKSLNEFLMKSFSFYRFNLKFQGIFSSLINYSTSIGVLILGAWLVSKELATIGTIVAFSQYVNWLVVFVNFMSNYATIIEPAMVSYQRIEEVLEMKDQAEDGNSNPKFNPSGGNLAIEVRQLQYNFGNTNIFNNFNLKVPGGKITMIKGASGRGKSTLFNILLKLYEVENDKVFIFGNDINNITPRDILSQISVVEQEPKFFGSEISDNLSTLDDYSLDKLRVKSEQLGLNPVLERLINSPGANKLKDLSGGERKRLGILRGLSRETPIILMDEPTVFIDETTAKDILIRARNVFPHATFLIISHDPSIEELADYVVMI